VTIVGLEEKRELLPQVASLLHNEWGSLYPGKDIESRVRRLESYLNLDHIPFTLVALEGDELLGTASAIENDMDSHLEWGPWLASVYVLPNRRGAGIGTALVHEVAARSASFGAKDLYLWTEKSEGLYESQGWATIAYEEYKGRKVSIMLKRFYGRRDPSDR
jgi:GNAT superfamily N-acetyltransferase